MIIAILKETERHRATIEVSDACILFDNIILKYNRNKSENN